MLPDHPAPIQFYLQELQVLQDQITRGRELLKEYSESLLAATNPGARAELRLQRARLQENLDSLKQDYERTFQKIQELQRNNPADVPANLEKRVRDVGAQLLELDEQVKSQADSAHLHSLAEHAKPVAGGNKTEAGAPPDRPGVNAIKDEQEPPIIHHRHTHAVVALAWKPGEKELASGSKSGNLKIGDAFTQVTDPGFHKHGAPIQALAWSPNGRYLASAARNILFWRGDTSSKQFVTIWHRFDPPAALAWAPDSTRIAAPHQNKVEIWDLTTSKIICRYAQHEHWVRAIAWSQKTGLIASAGNTAIHIWKPEGTEGKNLNVYLAGNIPPITALAWSPDGHYLAAASDANGSGVVQIWEQASASRKPLLTYLRHTDAVTAVAWAPEGTRLASSSKDGTVQIWNGLTGQHISTYAGHTGPVYAITWSPDGQYLASGGEDHTIQIWRPAALPEDGGGASGHHPADGRDRRRH